MLVEQLREMARHYAETKQRDKALEYYAMADIANRAERQVYRDSRTIASVIDALIEDGYIAIRWVGRWVYLFKPDKPLDEYRLNDKVSIDYAKVAIQVHEEAEQSEGIIPC